jgi:magnesium transporter
MIRVTRLAGRSVLQGGIELIGDWTEESEDCIWIDISQPQQPDVEPLLEEWFRFHELAAEDALSQSTLPKYDSFPRYDFYVFRMTSLAHAAQAVETEKLACFLGRTDFVLYSFLDYLVDAHFPLLYDIEERLDTIHEVIFSSPAPRLLDELLEIKRELNLLRRALLPQRELFNQISRGDAKFIAREHLIYFRDLYDHMYRIGESIDVERDMATTTMEAYLSVVANRTNDIMKVLTIFSAILLPINLIASIYGMNFAHMPELQWRFGYGWALGLMLAVAVLMLTWFWRRGWLWPRRRDLIRHARKVRRMLHRRTSRS